VLEQPTRKECPCQSPAVARIVLTALARRHERSDWSVVGQVAQEDAAFGRAQSA